MAIIYAGKSGSSPRLEDAVVCKVFDDKVRVGQFGAWKQTTGIWVTHARFFYLRTSYRIQVMGEDNAEDLADRP